MPQTFIALPIGSPGASVALPVCQPQKTFYAGGEFEAAQVVLEISHDGVSFTVAASFSLAQNEPKAIEFSAAYARASVVSLRSGTPVCFLAVNTVSGVRGSVPIAVPSTGVGPSADISELEWDKTFIAVAEGASVTCEAVVEVSHDDAAFAPFFKIEGRLLTKGDAIYRSGFLRTARVRILTGLGDGLALAAMSDPCGGLTPPAEPLFVTTIRFNGSDDELSPGYPSPSTWCDTLTNPPIVSVTFNQAIDPATVTGASVFLTGPGGPVAIGPYSFSAGNTVVSFTPSSPLVLSATDYVVHVTAGVETPDEISCEPTTFEINVVDCVNGCVGLMGGGTFPDTWAFAGNLEDISNVSAPRGLIVPALARYNSNTLAAVFIGGRHNGGSGTVWSEIVNLVLWNGVLAGFQTPESIPWPPFASPLQRRIDSSVASAVTTAECEIFTQGNETVALSGESGIFAYAGSNALRRSSGGLWSQPADPAPTTYVQIAPGSNFPSTRSKTNTVFVNSAGKIVWLNRYGVLVYDPVAGTKTLGAQYPTVGANFQWNQFGACQLHDGRILVAGGLVDPESNTSPSGQAAIYDLDADTWTTVGSLVNPRRLHTLVTLDSGRVLCVGGSNGPSTGTDQPTEWQNPVAMAEIFDPATNVWTNLAALATPRTRNATVKLPTGQVMVIGGVDASDNVLASCEIIGSLNTWVVGPTLFPGGVADPAAIVVPHPTQYTVIVAGGYNGPPGTVIVDVSTISYLTNPSGGPPPGGGALV